MRRSDAPFGENASGQGTNFRLLFAFVRAMAVRLSPFLFVRCVVLALAFFHHPREPLYHCGILMREERTYLFAECGDSRHVIGRKRKVEHVQILRHALLVDELRNNHDSALNLLTKHDLRRRHPVPRADFCERRVGERGEHDVFSARLNVSPPCLCLSGNEKTSIAETLPPVALDGLDTQDVSANVAATKIIRMCF